MLEVLLRWLNGLPKEYAVVLVSALPVTELRGAIPLGLSLGLSLSRSFWLSVLGNCAIIAPGLLFFEPVSALLRKKIAFLARFFEWLERRTKKNYEKVQRYEALALFMLVAVPLPMTGAWSGLVAASLFKVRFRYAFTAIAAGVFCAGLIVSALCVLGIFSWKAIVR